VKEQLAYNANLEIPDRLIDMAYRSVHVFKCHSRNKVRVHEMSSTIGYSDLL